MIKTVNTNVKTNIIEVKIMKRIDNKTDWAGIDKKSRDAVVKFMTEFWAKKAQIEDIVYTATDKSYPVDIEFNFVKDGKKYPYAIEVKDRDPSKYTFNDIMIDVDKYNQIKRRIENRTYINVFIINTYKSDDLIRMTRFDCKHTFDWKKRPATTLVVGGSKEIVNKESVFYTQYIEYRPDMFDEQWERSKEVGIDK